MRFANAMPVFDVVHKLRLRRIQSDLAHRVFEEQPILCLLDRFQFGADQFHAVFIKDAGFSQIHREIQTRLPAYCRKQRIRTLFADHFFGECDGERFHIGAIREIRIGHDGGRVRIDQNHLIAVGANALQA